MSTAPDDGAGVRVRGDGVDPGRGVGSLALSGNDAGQGVRLLEMRCTFSCASIMRQQVGWG